MDDCLPRFPTNEAGKLAGEWLRDVVMEILIHRSDGADVHLNLEDGLSVDVKIVVVAVNRPATIATKH